MYAIRSYYEQRQQQVKSVLHVKGAALVAHAQQAGVGYLPGTQRDQPLPVVDERHVGVAWLVLQLMEEQARNNFV